MQTGDQRRPETTIVHDVALERNLSISGGAAAKLIRIKTLGIKA
jgi:hypothetical protein